MIQSGESSFVDLATEFSDCSSAKRGGDLGKFGHGQMQRPFEEVRERKIGRTNLSCGFLPEGLSDLQVDLSS